MIYLASLPRSGSTLLVSLLNQREDTYASPTSNLCDTMGAVVQVWNQIPTTMGAGASQKDLFRILKGIMDSRYDTDKVVFDKNRGWPSLEIIETLSLFSDVKIVATVRPVVECLASFYKISKSEQTPRDFCKNNELSSHLFSSYELLKASYESCPDNFLLVDYDDLIDNTQVVMDRIADFTGQPHHTHDTLNVPPSDEQDKVWGLEDLHLVRSTVSHNDWSAEEVLGKDVFDYYQGGEFWNDKPEPIREKQPIQFQHDALMEGDFKKSKRLAYKNLKEFPDDPDIAFNAGWAKLSDGKVADGYRLLDKGRETTVWGDQFQSNQPTWSGERGATVLLRLERGLGDQIHQVRYARDLKAAGCTVVVSCQAQLAELLTQAEGVDVVVQHEAAGGVYHDFFLPAMSAPIQLGYKTNDNINGKAYITRPDVDVVPGRIGLRWQGFNGYEHATKRKFPSDLMFDAVKGKDCISLQKDEGSELRPRWMKSVPLDTWQDTAKAIASCEQVITSCTSVPHLAGAMGVPTWVVIPKVPYYLWTFPGADTPYYSSMKLFRQTEDDWEAPFEEISRAA